MANRSERATRADFIAGLRALADLYEEHAQLPVPAQVAGFPIYLDTDQYPTLALQLLGGELTDQRPAVLYDGRFGFELDGMLAGLHLCLRATPDEVCDPTTARTFNYYGELLDANGTHQ